MTAISRSDLADDIRGINASLALIKQTRGHMPAAEIAPTAAT